MNQNTTKSAAQVDALCRWRSGDMCDYHAANRTSAGHFCFDDIQKYAYHTLILFSRRRPPGGQNGQSLHRPVPAKDGGPQVQGRNPVHEDEAAQRQARKHRQFLCLRSQQHDFSKVCACRRPMHHPRRGQSSRTAPAHGEPGAHRPRVSCFLDCVVEAKLTVRPDYADP